MKSKEKTKKAGVLVTATVERQIFMVRGQAVMMDTHLAELYEVETRSLIQAVTRNAERFPADFMFQLNNNEHESLRSQFVMSKKSGRGGRRTLPYVFTEQGVAMLSSVLRSDRAIKVNIEIMRAFIKMRDVLAGHKELARKVDEHEHRLNDQDEVIISIVEEMRKQRTALPPTKPKRKIGFSK